MGAVGASAFGAQTASAQANNSAVVESTSTIQSDEIGNITNVDDMELVWEGRQLQSIGANGTPYFSYEYNIDGQRTKKTVTDFDTGETTTTEYFYNSGMLMGQKTGNDVLVFMYDESGDMFGFTYNGTPYYYVKNAQNDVWAVTNADGQAVALYFYDAWGDVAKRYEADGYEAIAEVNPILYRSYYCDLELGFYYLNTRYYAPTLHRFLNADGVLGANQDINAYNLFAYCSNDPVNFCDDSGCGKISNWFKSIGNKIKDWWNSVTPSSSITVPSSNSLISSAADAVLGAAGKALETVKQHIPYGSSSRGTIRGTPWQTGPKFPTAIKAIGKVATAISIASLVLDVGNTWTAQNGNTNGDRVIKTAVQFAGVGIGIAVGALASAAFVALSEVPVAGVVAFGAIVIVGNILIDYASNKIYEEVGIE